MLKHLGIFIDALLLIRLRLRDFYTQEYSDEGLRHSVHF